MAELYLGANQQFGGGGLEPPSPWMATSLFPEQRAPKARGSRRWRRRGGGVIGGGGVPLPSRL